MKTDRSQTSAPSKSAELEDRLTRMPRRAHHPGNDAKPERTASPAAMDEVFALLSRNHDRLQRVSDDTRRLANHGTAPQPTADKKMPTTPTDRANTPSGPQRSASSRTDPNSLRNVTDEMDRQHERLMQLLRDIIA